MVEPESINYTVCWYFLIYDLYVEIIQQNDRKLAVWFILFTTVQNNSLDNFK